MCRSRAKSPKPRRSNQGHAAKPPADLTGHGTILLVEDEEGLRGLNARGLTSRGYTVLEAGNGVEAIEVIESRGGEVDLVVSDVVMPEMDGPTLAKELRARNPNLKIIFVSGYAEDAFEKNLPDGAQVQFPAKPFTLKQLVAAVKDTMARAAERREPVSTICAAGGQTRPVSARISTTTRTTPRSAGGAIAPARGCAASSEWRRSEAGSRRSSRTVLSMAALMDCVARLARGSP